MTTLLKRIAVAAFLAAVGWCLVAGLDSALVHLLGAVFLAYLFFPLAQRLEGHGVRRSHAAVAIIALVTLILFAFLALLVTYLGQELRSFADALPSSTAAAIEKIQALCERFGWSVKIDKASLVPQLKKYASSISPDVASSAAEYAKTFFSSTAGIVVGLVNVYLLPVFFYYVIVDFDGIVATGRALIPRTHLATTTRIIGEANAILERYIRGQLTLALIRALLYGMGLLLLGLDFGLLLGLLTGVLTIIPYVGVTLGLGCAGVVVLATNAGWFVAGGVVAVFAVVAAVDQLVLRPKIIEKKSGLGDLGVMIALMVGGNLFGILGIFLAIPVAGIVKLLLRELRLSYQRSALYQGTTPDDPP